MSVPSRDFSAQRATRPTATASPGRAGSASHRFFQVEETKVVFPTLAHHHSFGLAFGIGVEPVQFPVDLGLQVAGVGGYPHGRVVGFRPKAGRCDVAQGLADTGPRFRQHKIRCAFDLPRGEALAKRRGIVRLLWPRLRICAQQRRQTFPRCFLRNGNARRNRTLGFVAPDRQAVPDVDAALQRTAAGHLQRAQDLSTPGPTGRSHDPGNCCRVAVLRCGSSCQVVQHQAGELGQEQGLFFRIIPVGPGPMPGPAHAASARKAWQDARRQRVPGGQRRERGQRPIAGLSAAHDRGAAAALWPWLPLFSPPVRGFLPHRISIGSWSVRPGAPAVPRARQPGSCGN